MGAGVLLLVSGLFHVVVWLANGAPSLQGPVTWRKPIEFGLIVANGLGPDSTVANASIIGAAGELKVPHALGLHGLQVLAVLALILERTPVVARAAVIAVACCALGYGLLLAAATLQTYSGLGPLALTPLALLAALVGVVLIAGPYLRGLSALRRPSLA